MPAALHRTMQPRLLFLLLLAGLCPAFGQQPVASVKDTLVQLKEVPIRAETFSRSDHGARLFRLDTSRIAMLSSTTLATRLDREAPLFIKSYGPGSLSTLALRGTGAAHTTVLWNGMPLNSPMLGLYDFSLLPGFLLGEVTVQSGGNGCLAGSGAVGGAIFIDPVQDTLKGHQVSLLAGGGSFGEMFGGAGYRYTNGKVTTQTRFYHQQALNNFRFRNLNGEMQQQSHACFSQYGFSHDTRLGTAAQHLDLHAWYLKNRREIPPLMLSRFSEQEQEDASLRFVAKWAQQFRRFAFHIRAGLIREDITYADGLARIDDHSRATTLQGDAGMAFKLNEHLRIEAEAAWTEAWAAVPHYATEARMQQQTLALKTVWEHRSINTYIALREGFFNGEALPFLPSGGFRVSLHRNWSVRGDAAAVYRVPTLNDRYWNPGGNAQLLPEEGYNTAMALQWTGSSGALQWSLDPGLFYSALKNAIVWLPGSEGYFKAINLHHIRSKGFEAQARLDWSHRETKLSLRFTPVYTISEITETSESLAEALHKQLIYTPRILYKTQVSLQHKAWSLRYYHNYTGFRYTTLDHSHSLEPFQLSEAVAGWQGNLFGHSTTATLTVRNLFNESYQVIAWRAMPGRSVSLGVMVEMGR